MKANLEGMKILYVEDEDEIRAQMSEMIELGGAEVRTACNGEEGLVRFMEERPDIVISDIRMPILDGIGMCEAIREADKEVPILFTTAFSDTDYLIRALELGANYYLIKPIRAKQLFEYLGRTQRLIADRRAAESYRKEQIIKQVELEKSDLMTRLANLFPCAAMVISEGKMVFANQSFLRLFDEETLRELRDGKSTLDAWMLPYRDGIASLEELEPDAVPVRIVKLRTCKGSKVFNVRRKDERLLGDDQDSTVIMLQDITFQEYQRMKIDHYNLFLEQKMFDLQHARTQTRPTATPAAVESAPEPVAPSQPDEAKKSVEVVAMDEQDSAVLRRSHVHKINAEEFCEQIDQEMLDNVRELMEHIEEIRDHLREYTANRQIEDWREIGEEAQKIASVINQMFEFADLAYAFQNLAGLLQETSGDSLDNKKLKTIQVFLLGMLDDLGGWIENIFIQKTAQDVHYLDASLFSTMLQLEMELAGRKKQEEDEEDLVLF